MIVNRLVAHVASRQTMYLRQIVLTRSAVSLTRRIHPCFVLFDSRRITAIVSRSICEQADGNILANGHVNDRGEELYNLAMDALTKVEETKKLKEEKLLREQYDAMNRQRQKTRSREKARADKRKDDPRLAKLDDYEDHRDRAAGVAVVRTIVKQSQPKKVQIDKYVQEEYDEASWQKTARDHMEEAAFRYGYPDALVRLGNDALEGGRDKESSFVDIDRLKGWADESPIPLQNVLDYVAYAEGSEKTDARATSYLYEKCLSPNQRLAVCLYREAGKLGSSEGLFNLGHVLLENVDVESPTKDSLREEAFGAFYKSMELDDADAMYFLAVQFMSHDDEDASETSIELSEFLKRTLERMNTAHLVQPLFELQQESVQPLVIEDELIRIGYNLLLRAALQHGHGPALHHLALLHHEANEEDDEYKKLLSAAASTGHPDSLFLQGYSYYHGIDGHEKNTRTALTNFLAAAENGSVDAMVSAGAIFHKGARDENGKYIIEQDMPRAFDLYQKAGEMGSIEGWRNVVHCYATGQGVPKCLETAQHIAETMLKEDGNKSN